MLHLRADYDAIQPWPVKRPHNAKMFDPEDGSDNAKPVLVMGVEEQDAEHAIPLIPDDEPVFLLRGQDPAAAATVRAYAGFAEVAGMDSETCQRIRMWADQMETYAIAIAHGAPDVPEGCLR